MSNRRKDSIKSHGKRKFTRADERKMVELFDKAKRDKVQREYELLRAGKSVNDTIFSPLLKETSET